MKVLEPYINSGTIVCPSEQTSIYECATAEWKTENARKRMAQLISNNSYSPKGKNSTQYYVQTILLQLA